MTVIFFVLITLINYYFCSTKVFVCVIALAIAQCQAGNIGVISTIAAGNIHSDSVGHSYSAPQQSHDVGYSYPAAPAGGQIPIPSYSSGQLQHVVKVIKIVEDHGHGLHSHANVIAPPSAPQQHVKHIKVHQGLQSYPDHEYYTAPASPQYVKVLKVSHQEGQITGVGQQSQNIQVIRVHHGDHGHGYTAPVATPIVHQKQAPAQLIKIINVIRDHGAINHSAHHQIAQPIVQNQPPQPVKVIKVYHDNGSVKHGYAAAAAAAPVESGWAPAGSSSVGW